MPPEIMDYRKSGVDVQAGETAVRSIKELVKRTYNSNVLSELGGFGGLFKFPKEDFSEPILVASTDGVGTKLRVAIMADRFYTIGKDLVNHCVNDILVQGALPLFFLDYIGVGKLDPNKIKVLISGMVNACCENSCALIGGEMAEMPGIYQESDFDLVGTIVGVVEKDRLLPGDRIKKGDLVVGLPSSGLHTNGYSLARKIIFDQLGLKISSYIPDLGCTVQDTLLEIHKSYLDTFKPLLADPRLHGLAHITGGGIPGNLKRIIPDHLTAALDYRPDKIPDLYHWLKAAGGLTWDAMLEAFNLGVGMIAVLDASLAADLASQTKVIDLGEIREATSETDRVLIHI